jgi:hypothetical protein
MYRLYEVLKRTSMSIHLLCFFFIVYNFPFKIVAKNYFLTNSFVEL